MERLLDYFTPEHYDLKLKIDKVAESVHGQVTIIGKQLAPVVKFHAENLTVDRVKFGKEYLKFTHEKDLLALPPLKPHRQPITVEIDFHYQLSHNMQGVYLSTYQHNGEEERIVTTQFESHYARQAFPCIDEPAAKATFQLTLTSTDPTDIIISNTPPLEDETAAGTTKNSSTTGQTSSKSAAPGQAPTPAQSLNAPTPEAPGKTTTFTPTPRMSTYLLAFCLGHFHHRSATSAHGVEVTTYCALSQSPDSLDFANHIATASLDYYDSLFGVKYPLKKLDQVALPDFESGAMENWGLVTYREQCLLADHLTASDQKEYIATVIAHELSHQWFGNLVTMAWWDDLWLNESFATAMEYLCVDHIHPEYQIWQDFFTGDCLAALSRDALPGVQAVQQPVHDPAEIPTLFDGAIVYAKGARLMLMLIRLMTPRRFFAGIKDYFKKHQYQNTVADDLWSALQPHADFDVKEFMHTWISQPGYPVITDGVQQRFLLTGATDGSRWTSPTPEKTSVSSASGEHKDVPGRSEAVSGEPDSTSEDSSENWPIPEIKDDMSGHYLINLSGPEFQAALDNFDRLSLEQRLRLLIDRNYLSLTSLVSSASLLDILPKFAKDPSEPLWSILSTILGNIRFFCPDFDENGEKSLHAAIISGEKDSTPTPTPESELYKKFLQKSIATQYSRLSVKPKPQESSNDTKLRQTILAQALASAHPAYLEEIAAEYRPDPSEIPPDTRSAILRARFRTAGEADFDEFLAAYQSTPTPDLKSDLRLALCSSYQPAHLARLFALLTQPSVVRPQDHLYFYVALLRNPAARLTALDWLYSHWDYLREMTGDKSLEDYPRIAAGALRTEAEATRFFDFFNQFLTDPALRRTIEVARPQVDANLRRLQLDTTAVHRRLRELAA